MMAFSSRGWVPVVLAVGAAVAVLALLEALAQVLPPWWFRTDYCPQDPLMTCGGPAPIMLAFLGAAIGIAVVVCGVRRWRGDD